METTRQADIIGDPVSHISISGVHGRKELDERLARARVPARRDDPGLGTLLTGALIGAAAMYLLLRRRNGAD